MSSLNNPENRNNSHAAHPSLGKRTEEQTPYSEREVVEATLDALAMNGASLTKTIKACQMLKRGAYSIWRESKKNWRLWFPKTANRAHQLIIELDAIDQIPLFSPKHWNQ